MILAGISRWLAHVASGMALCCLFLYGTSSNISAQAPRPDASELPVVRELEVPASQPGLWPPGPWQGVPRESYLAFLKSLQRPADAAPNPVPVIESVSFEATLATDSLIGNFEAAVLLPPDPASRVLDLSGTGLALSGLQWDAAPATWGVAPEDRLVVMTAPPSRRLVGKWSLRGQAVFDALDFEFAGVPALASRMRLTLPAGWTVEAELPIRSEAAPAGDAAGGVEARTWVVDLGHRRRTRISLRRAAAQASSLAPPAWEAATVSSITRTGIETVTDLSLLGAADSPVLAFEVPKDLQVGSVLVGETLIPFRREPGEKLDRLTVQRLHVPQDPRTTLRFRGTQPVRWSAGKAFALHDVGFSGGSLLRRRVTLQIDRPMELQDLKLTGFEQTDVSADGIREAYVFEAIGREARLQVSASEPEVRVSTESWILADLVGENPFVWYVWSLESLAGETYRFDVPVPDPWEVVRVMPVSETPESTLAQWNFERKGAQGLLSVEFRRGLTPQTPKRIAVQLRGQPLGTQSAALPILTPPASREVSALAAVWLPAGMEVRMPPNSTWRRGVIGDFPAEFFQVGGGLAGDLLFDRSQFFLADGKKGLADLRLVPAMIDPNDALQAPESRAPSRPIDESGARDATAPRAARLTVTSTLGAPGAPDHIHTAEYRLAANVRLDELKFTLPAGLRPVSIQDEQGELAFATSEGRLVFGEPQRKSSILHFEYRTTAAPGWLLASETVQFPQLEGFTGPLAWRIDLAGQRAFFRNDLPWSRSSEDPLAVHWSQMLGPLARPDGERFFNPFRRADWRSLILPERVEYRDGDEVLQIAPQVPVEVRLETYLVPRVRTLAWALFLGCLVAGAFARRGRLRLIRQIGYFSMALFVPLAWFLPPLYGMQMGAIVTGLTLVYLIPRSIVVRDQFWRPRQIVPPDALRASTVIATATGLLLTISALTAQEPLSNAATVLIPTEDGQPLETVQLDPRLHEAWTHWKKHAAPPQYLLESARYAVSETSGRLTGRAEIDVSVLETGQPVTVRLPFDRVTLDGASGCQVDGQVVRVLPAADGKSILVPLPAPADGTVNANSSMDRRVRLSIDFLPRLDPATPQRMDLVVPAAGDTTLTFRSSTPDPGLAQTTIESIGPIRTPEAGVWSTALGADGRLSVAWPQRNVAPATRDVQAQSFVEIGPLALLVQTRIVFPSDGATQSERTILVPFEAVVESVTGDALHRFQIAHDEAADEQRVNVSFLKREAAERTFVDVIYRLPFEAAAESLLLPPLVRVPGHPLPQHRIGISSRGIAPVLPAIRPDDPGRLIPVDEFIRDQPDELLWPTPQHCLIQSVSAPVALTRAPQPVPRAVRIRQGLIVDRSQTRWTALVELEPRRTPLLSHAFLLDPRITVTSISAEQDGAERLIRSLRKDDRLTLFIRSRTNDGLTIRIEGTMSGDRLNWARIPALAVVDGETVASDVTIRNESGWLLEAGNDAGLIPLPVPETARRPFVFDLPTQGEAQFRLRPGPEAADARLWVRLAPVSETQLSATWHYDFTPVDGPLHVVTGHLPVELAGRIESSSLPFGPPSESGTVPFSLPPSGQATQHNELTFHALLDLPTSGGWTIPEPILDSARVVQRRLLIAKSSPLIPTAGSATTLSSLRNGDLPSAWKPQLKLSDYEAYAGRAEDWTLESRVEIPATGTARTPLVEAVVWYRPDQPLRGITRIVGIAERPAALRIDVPEGQRVTRIRMRGTVRIPDEAESERPLVFRIDPARSPEAIELEWTAGIPSTLPVFDVPRPAGPHRVLLTVIPARERLLVYRQAQPIGPVAGALEHFSNLLETVRLQRTRAWLLDDPFLEAVRRTERGLTGTMTLSTPDVTPELLARFDELTATWREIQETLPVNAVSPGGRGQALRMPPETDLVTSIVTAPSPALGQFFVLEGNPPAVRWSLSRSWLLILLVVACGLALLAILRRADHMQRRVEAAEWVADHAFLAMFALGGLWWLALSPSALGLAIMLTTAAVKLLHVLTHRRMREESRVRAAADA